MLGKPYLVGTKYFLNASEMRLSKFLNAGFCLENYLPNGSFGKLEVNFNGVNEYWREALGLQHPTTLYIYSRKVISMSRILAFLIHVLVMDSLVVSKGKPSVSILLGADLY